MNNNSLTRGVKRLLLTLFYALFLNFSISAQTSNCTISISNQVNVTCHGASTGSVTLLASGGTSPYTYKKDATTSNATGVFTGLAAGTYVFTVTDAASCTQTQEVTLIEPLALSLTTSKTDATCSQANGTATVSVNGGAGTKNITCDSCPSAPVSGVFSGLSAKTYVFTATDTNHCTKTVSLTLSNIEETPPAPDTLLNQTFCKNDTVTIRPTGGTTYKFYGADPTAVNIPPLSIGTYFSFAATADTTIWITNIVGRCESEPISTTISTKDTTLPKALCRNVTVQLNASGTATLTTTQVDNGSTDNCGIAQIQLSKTSFDCTNLGTNRVYFTATDKANNTSSCSATITVVDNIAPQITCPDPISVQLTSGECRRVLTFTATASDNCSTPVQIQQLTGLQSGELFGIGAFTTGFKATDVSGNTSFCSFNITVKEHIRTGSMVCLSQVNFTLGADCQTSFLPENILNGQNYGCFEHYTVQLQTLGGSILGSNIVTGSHVGSTLRAVVLDNVTGNRCSGTFTVFDFTPPIIQAPADIAVMCDLVNNAGTPQPSNSGEPTIVKECSLPTSYYYSDQNFDIHCPTFLTNPPIGFPSDLSFNYVLAQNAKRIIVRTFTVTDRAGNVSKARQVIYIRSRTIGEVTLPPSSLSLTCRTARTEPTDTVINGITIKGTGFPSFNNNILSNSFCAIYTNYSDVQTQTSGNTILTIQRTWSIINGCTNEYKTWIQTITINDASPTLTLLQNNVFQIPVGQPLSIQANNLISSLSDDCTANHKMQFGLRIAGSGTGFPTATSLSFTCSMLGTYTVEVWVKDEGGHILTKNTSISVKNDAGNCPTISGMIAREDLLVVPATIKLYNSGNDSLSAITGTSYAFKNLTAGGAYRIMPTRPNTDWINGVTMFDVALLSRQILGVESFSSPYRYIAADVDRNGDIDAVDLLLMQRLVLRVVLAFPNNNSWRFVLKNYIFDDPNNPFSSDFPESLWVPNLTTTPPNGDFVAVKIGDVNNSAGSVAIRGSLPAFKLWADDRVLEKNKTYHIPIKISPYQRNYEGNMISALQFALSVDKKIAQIESISQGDLPNFKENNIGLFQNEGIATAAWYRSPQQIFAESDSFMLLNIAIKATENTRLSSILAIDPLYTEGVAFDEKGNGAPVTLVFKNAYKVAEKPVLLPNRPNPFKEETILAFTMPEDGYAKLTVVNLMGKEVLKIEKTFSKGLNEVLFDTRMTPSVSSGIFIVRLQTTTGMAERKIVISD